MANEYEKGQEIQTGGEHGPHPAEPGEWPIITDAQDAVMDKALHAFAGIEPAPSTACEQTSPFLELHTELAIAQSRFHPVLRTRKVSVYAKPEKGGHHLYDFHYAPLETILAATLPALNRQGFYLTQRIIEVAERHLEFIETALLHQLGTLSVRTPILVSDDANAQGYSSATTYARRLGVTLLLCVAADEDDDGNQAVGNDARAKGAKPPPRDPKEVYGPLDGPKSEREVRNANERIPDNQPLPPREGRYKPGKNTPPPKDAPKPIPVEPPPPKPKGREYNELEIAKLEGRVIDAVQDMQEACVEGRRIGIEQIWAEIKADEYVGTRVWEEMKKTPDLFRTMKEVLKPAGDKTARGPKPTDSKP